MRRTGLVGLAVACIAASAAQAAEWRLQRIGTPARVSAIETADKEVRIEAGGLWYALARKDEGLTLRYIDGVKARLPDRALPDGSVTAGEHDIARAWLSDPTDRYDHGVLGDKIEAATVTLETQDGKRFDVSLKNDAVFEDLRPRIADLDGDGRDEAVVVKSYLKRGAALAVIAWRKNRYEIVAETPPSGAPNMWLAPAAIADFLGDGQMAVAIVRQPHMVGQLELWSLRDGHLVKTGDMPDFSNHAIGSRAIGMSVAADFDGDGVIDLALPSLDRMRLRIVSFHPQPREIASIALPAMAATDLGLVASEGTPLIVLGLSDGSLAVAEPAH